jgi:hypothetical protein
MEDWAFFDIMRVIVFWSSPVVLLLGIILMTFHNYRNVEVVLGKEYGLRKRILPKLEQNIYSFHEWCLKRRTLIGLVCIIYSLVVFFAFRKSHSLNEVIGEVY